MGRTEVSIVVAAFEAEAFLARALRSVLQQEKPVSEIIVVDDGSRDRTADVARSFGGRVKVVQQANAGPGAARNRGFEACSGDLVGFVDADDELLPEMTRLLSAALERFPAASVASGGYLLDSRGVVCRRPLRGRVVERDRTALILNFFDVARRHDVAKVGSVLVRHEAFRAVAGFREDIRFGEDLALWARLAGQYDWAYVDTPVMVYHHDASTSATLRTPESCKPAHFIARADELGSVLRPELRAGYERYRRDMILRQARAAIAQGELVHARRLLAAIESTTANVESGITSLLSRSRLLARAVLGCTGLAREIGRRWDRGTDLAARRRPT